MFRRLLPEISIFHSPSSPQSLNALSLLRSALSNPYPLGNPKGHPLQFNLSVVEAPPTPDQLKTIVSYFPSPTTNTLKELAEKNPKALKWPIVVDWNNGKASIGDVDGVKDILETLRKKRDGELKDEPVDQPKGWFS